MNLLSFIVVLLVVITIVSFARPASADPHAMFYTDRAQEQLFYNVLAALNQADYVEAPASEWQNYDLSIPTSPSPTSPPNIDYDKRIGNYLATGTYIPRDDLKNRTVTYNKDGSITTSSPLEPQERTNLPRITVRQVTSDNGDAFLRETLQRRALAEQMRVEFSGLACRILEGIYGPQAVSDNNQQANYNNQESPCKKFLDADNLAFSQ